MSGETDLSILLESMKPEHRKGDYVFCTVENTLNIDLNTIVMMFREAESITVILPQSIADALNLDYTFVAAWITLSVHSSLSAVGLTAAFSNALANHKISCNVVAAYYHDHIFVDKADIEKAMEVLHQLSV